jgi:hypothetical protein
MHRMRPSVSTHVASTIAPLPILFPHTRDPDSLHALLQNMGPKLPGLHAIPPLESILTRMKTEVSYFPRLHGPIPTVLSTRL